MMTREKFLKRFAELTNEMVSVTTKKNNDYGGESDPWKNFREFGEKGIIVRMSDKWARLKTAVWEGRKFQVAETLKDTLLDLAVYCLILVVWMEDKTDTEVHGILGNAGNGAVTSSRFGQLSLL